MTQLMIAVKMVSDGNLFRIFRFPGPANTDCRGLSHCPPPPTWSSLCNGYLLGTMAPLVHTMQWISRYCSLSILSMRGWVQNWSHTPASLEYWTTDPQLHSKVLSHWAESPLVPTSPPSPLSGPWLWLFPPAESGTVVLGSSLADSLPSSHPNRFDRWY